MHSSAHTTQCGRRGGFMELLNFDSSVRTQILKRASINLCSNVAVRLIASAHEVSMSSYAIVGPDYGWHDVPATQAWRHVIRALPARDEHYLWSVCCFSVHLSPCLLTLASTESLKRRAHKLAAAFNSMEGMSCGDPQVCMHVMVLFCFSARLS